MQIVKNTTILFDPKLIACLGYGGDAIASYGAETKKRTLLS